MLVFTSCSFTKRVPISPALSAPTLRARHLDGVAQEWARRIKAASVRFPANQVYGGQAVVAAKAAAERLGARLHFVSAGLSLVEQDELIPGYDLSIGSSPSAPTILREGLSTASAWWRALNGALGTDSPISRAIREHNCVALVALPEHYLRMIEGELLQLSGEDRRKLRLVVAGATDVAPALASQVVRYDQRLQRLAGAPKGALTSFTQRALLHFAGLLAMNPSVKTVAAQRALVTSALDEAPAQDTRRSQPMSDLKIKTWIRHTDPNSEASKTSLLRQFRQSGNSCESRRFDRLHESLR